MKVTVCQLDPREDRIDACLTALGAHVAAEHSDFLLLPEMCFSEWLAAERTPDPRRWAEAVGRHVDYIRRLDALGTATVVGTRPIVNAMGSRRNQAYLWTREGGGPTSEILPHLRAHSARIRAGGEERAVLHTHPTNLIALTYAIPLTTHSLTRLLWEMHTECIVVFPRGCGFLDWRLPGSEEQARATEEVFEKRTLVVWQHHGAVALGPDFQTAFGLIETAEKAAGIYLQVSALGPVSQKLTTGQLTALAQKFGVDPDPEILGSGA